MVSLNDVLLAMSNMPVDDPIAEIWGRGLQGGYKIIEYTGTLPITINANGDALIDYRIYGADRGAGEQTESGEPAGYKLPMTVQSANLYGSENEIGNISFKNGENETSDTRSRTKDYISVKPSTIYTLIYENGSSNVKYTPRMYSDSSYLTYDEWHKSGTSFNTTEQTTRVRFIFDSTESLQNIMLVEGSTVPTKYIPYSKQAVPVYIGDTPLGEDEYVSYSEQAIYKRTENLCPPLSSSKWSPGYITNSGTIAAPSVTRQEKVSDWIKVDGRNSYCLYDISGFPTGSDGAWFGFGIWDENRNWLIRYNSSVVTDYKTWNLPDNAAYVRLTMRTYGEDDDSLSFTKSSIPPDPYIPYLKLTDPPVSFPDIPTIKGKTIIDYDGTPKPSQMYVKYKGKG